MGLPSLERLVQHPFWQEYVPKFHEQYMAGSDATKQNLKLTNNAKEQIKIAAQKTEQRLRDEQRSVSICFKERKEKGINSHLKLKLIWYFQVKNQKRLVRVQELMSSEEEKKKIKHQKAVSNSMHKHTKTTCYYFSNFSIHFLDSVFILIESRAKTIKIATTKFITTRCVTIKFGAKSNTISYATI